jgi:nuclear pore complex protein Nup160
VEENLDERYNARPESVGNIQETTRSILDMLSEFDTVKGEVNEDVEIDLSAPLPPSTHSEWFKALISAYVAATTHARYELCLLPILLLFFLSDQLHDWPPSLL